MLWDVLLWHRPPYIPIYPCNPSSRLGNRPKSQAKPLTVMAAAAAGAWLCSEAFVPGVQRTTQAQAQKGLTSLGMADMIGFDMFHASFPCSTPRALKLKTQQLFHMRHRRPTSAAARAPRPKAPPAWRPPPARHCLWPAPAPRAAAGSPPRFLYQRLVPCLALHLARSF